MIDLSGTPDTDTISPEATYRGDDDKKRRLERLEKLATLLDAQFVIPGTGVRFGLDSLIGLIPGIGDTATGIVSLWIVWQGVRLGVGPGTVIRMLVNVLIDTVIGSIPLLGDIFDVAFKANLANIRLIQRHAGV
ncbi:DUF4112 domain-containing protein [Aquisalinus flavus]|uniref:Membrane protein n=1 Tax=Aquisalinus flavus TaxID=1526572 RepID=A0A8J2Y5V9_9PROT|nr:DUF4112 domain-containing protein [Aquisalinus flavus]MBD0425294.1 DUF4112 domain-containing protein [Aquisalinus flavus]UNE49053.1 DUF4112 domain-containing protein [Aquisalinus flavus]GGD17203.1 membrane protein [Aquisalinus flavus]